ncbi:hypothetical protein N657DRAFT_584598 [Parathielavia appendiculata]|uniref:Uncharacterized protein n=1 Tax=Parathielavia appendiculata TaxID=2587402 RepID=A0AAN6U7T9_9PEZI|nr:hypothetical protein N657DRAFT_584598 [Parathielavia appendiculata]
MRFTFAAAAVTLLAAQAHGYVTYWCTGDGVCDNSPGVGPTYDCGKKLKLGDYDSKRKRWSHGGDEVNWDKFWRTGGFYDCCHDKNKGACYDVQNT